ncbi:diguanylate cyclase domain-containing protein [Actinoplanes sp. NPDC020271]|uniref:diguanylate cyclase domain-containing protein n=1 Tax=Actinoplanes sp. NPDC020271 TaxID=3363896 RepID=UPI0037A1A04C
MALAAATMTANTATGAPALLAAGFVVANLVQATIFGWSFHRWLPQLWEADRLRPLQRPRDLWRLSAIACLCSACGAAVGPPAVWLVSGTYSWWAPALWLTRSTVSIMLIGTTGLLLGAWWHRRRASTPRTGPWTLWAAMPVQRRLEYAILVVMSAMSYGVVFGVNRHLPLAFTVLALTIWSGSRLHTAFVAVHDLVFGTAAILFTLAGRGVFANIAFPPARAMVAQAFVGMIAMVGLALALGRDERSALLDQLRGAERVAARQAKMMNAIVDSMAEGVTVVDEPGRFLLRNAAVRRLVGGVVSPSDRMARPDFYGLFHPDGRPLAPDEMPYRRALAGTHVRSMDIMVRNPGVPEGRILNVNSTALPDGEDGTRCAVTVFHDVTAERRHRQELASFAGVVAHDLQNPLATVEGWSTALTEMIEEAPAGSMTAPLAAPVQRISRAAARMRDLIDDLLAYTTSRDANLAPSAVDLGDLVNDIAIARIDQAQSNDAPAPAFTIGRLHPVYADPVLVRQLLENLIGNAIKYNAPGASAHLTVTTRHDDAMVEVTIDDNGIGIPPGQHEAIFDNFHRAHATNGYTGTGLGLAICQRIVQRHGGTIRATDNPAGQGTRMTFTLPADAAALPAPETDTITAEPSPEPDAATTGATPAPVPAVTPAPAIPPGRQTSPATTFDNAAHLVLNYLHEQMPLAFWAVTRVENGRQTYLYLDADNGYGLRQGESHPWKDSFCVHMAAGDAPAVARDAQMVPQYAAAGVNALIDIGTYAGAAITEPDGTLFGAICGLDPQIHTGDPCMITAEPLLALFGELLSTALAADRAYDHYTDAYLREQLSGHTDPLTGLPNRRAWVHLLDQARTRYQRLADPLVVAVIDLDRLKTINDSHGHAAGDAYLIAAAAAIRRALRDSDVVARLGGDEFGLLLNSCTEADAPDAIGRIHAALEAAAVAASIGWSAVTTTDGLAAAWERADDAMYASKRDKGQRQALSAAPPPVIGDDDERLPPSR